MKKHHLIIILFIALSINKVNAQTDFIYLTESSEATIYVKEEKTVNVEHFIWVKMVFDLTTYKNKKGKIVKKNKGTKMIQYCANCADRTLKKIMSFEYDASGNLTNSDQNESEAMPIIPETLGEAYFKYACD
jgi:hypothetical protein